MAPSSAGKQRDGDEKLPNPSRGCGHLKPGKAYIRGAGFSEGGVLPSWVELDPPLPFREIGTEGQFTRGFQKIDGLTLQLALEETTEFVPHYPGASKHEVAIENHLRIIDGLDFDWLISVSEAERHIIRVRERGVEDGTHWGDIPTTEQTDLLMRAGESYYPDPADFADEAIQHGLSKVIPVTPTRDPPDVVPGITRCWIMHPAAGEGYGGAIIGFAYLAEVVFTEPEEGELPSYIEEARDAGKLDVRQIEPPQEPSEDPDGSAVLDDFEDGSRSVTDGSEVDIDFEVSVGEDPRLVEVIASGRGLSKNRGVLHRLDEDARCHNAPENPSTATDLVTAAVGDHDHTLCEGGCEWPAGAEAVLAGDDDE